MKSIINMHHGAGGKDFDQLMQKIILPALDNPYLQELSDGAILGPQKGRLVMATDAHVVSPRQFPGGNLGKLAFCGTVNDLAVMGARPLYLTMGMIIEEGLSLEELQIHLAEIGGLSKKWGIPVVAGDTKVVERGKGDGLFITTSGLGSIENSQVFPDNKSIAPGDSIIINGAIGNHGIAVLSQRENLNFFCDILSDCAPLHEIILSLWQRFAGVKCMRDPTRGGVAAVLNELANAANVEMEIFEGQIKVDQGVRSACELLGLDPLLLANEGKFILFAPPQDAENIIQLMQTHEFGRDAHIIGKVHKAESPLVRSTTALGGNRIIPWPNGEQMPRIC